MTSQSFEPVKTGVIGLGRFGRLHALTLRGLSEARLTAMVARRQSSLDGLAKEIPDVPGWTDLDQAIEESDTEAWVVACSTESHVDVTTRLLSAGKKVLLEKPVSSNLADALRLEPWVQPDSGNLIMGHILLFNSEFQQLRDEAARRGRIAYVDCVRHRPSSIVKQFPGENPLHAAMIHDLYSVQVLMDREEPVEFQLCCHRTSEHAVDLALARMKWQGGTVASLAASYLTPDGMPPRGFDRMEVFGDGWAARLNPNPRPIEVWDQKAQWPMALEIRTGISGATGMLAEELRCFCRVVRGRQVVPVGATYQDALQVQRWMNRLELSESLSGQGK